MVTVLTEFIAKDATVVAELESIFHKLLKETPAEQGYISYEILKQSNRPFSYYIFEKWASQENLDDHAKAVDAKGYATQAITLLENQLENNILQSLSK